MKITTAEKAVRISHLYLIMKLLFQTLAFLVYFVLLWMLSYVVGLSDSTAVTFSLVTAAIMSLVFMSNAVLYWLNSGIYITQNGDHVVKQGGWFAREDKLLNGVIVANQVKRNPIDQIFGMASIQTGLFGDKRLVGVRYGDIKDYDNRVRNRMDEPFRTMF